MLAKQYHRAKEEGRLCRHCKWMVAVKRWKKGHRLCPNCEDALKGVNVSGKWGPYYDEPLDLTGEMI